VNRRDLLKLFGAGATIAPVAASGVPLLETTARLVEPPKVELFDQVPITEPLSFMKAMIGGRLVSAVTTLTTDTGDSIVITSKSYVASVHCRPVDVTSERGRGPWREFIPGPLEGKWDIHGVVSGEMKVFRSRR
jgi:hypothetical protein